ncbi:MAG: dihydrolipoamide acetyltransferase family protein, partial [Acidobacteriota bacterium]
MATPVEMPKTGVTVEECLLVKWNKRKGEAVAAGELVAEIESDKAAFEVVSPVEGILLETFFNEGDFVPVYANICVVGAEGESVEEFRPGASVEKAVAPVPVPATLPSRARQQAAETLLSPRARRFAAEHGIDLTGVVGSGPGGRVLEADLQRALAARAAPVSGVRERIARRMRESLASSAQYTLNSSAGAAGLLSLRARIKAAREQRDIPDINISEMVIFCAVKALERMPELNAELIEGKLYQRAGVNIAFACDTPRGLMAPVIKDSRKLSLAELALKVKVLTAQATEGHISPDDLAGATFTVSNLGNLGIESFTPILNPPQVALLGVNSIEVRPVR